MKRSPKELIKRGLCFLTGLYIMSVGIAFSIIGDLGTSPISSLPYVLNQITGFTVGNMTICMHCCLIIFQILVLRKRFELYQLLQLPVAFIFGYMVDFSIYCVSGISYSSYLGQWGLCIIGIVVLALGVSVELTADVVVLAGEGVVVALCKVTDIKKGNMKIMVDSSLVAVAAVLSVLFLHKLVGVREGTLASAIFVGTLVKFYMKPLAKLERKLLADS